MVHSVPRPLSSPLPAAVAMSIASRAAGQLGRVPRPTPRRRTPWLFAATLAVLAFDAIGVRAAALAADDSPRQDRILVKPAPVQAPQPVQVTTGDTDGSMTEVLSGLQPGAQVITGQLAGGDNGGGGSLRRGGGAGQRRSAGGAGA